jgi:hypothetical protein
VAGCCEYGDEPSGSCVTELVSCARLGPEFKTENSVVSSLFFDAFSVTKAI